MNFNRHSELEGLHAFLGASRYHWLNYTDEKLDETYSKWRATEKGTELHEFAKMAIKLGIKMPRNRQTINMYINDAIGFQMIPEQPLFYSFNAFGTVDTICFKKQFLRIHDLKTGETPTSMKQLLIYDALFCLEYGINPFDIEREHRIYQLDDIKVETPNADAVRFAMDRIIECDKRIDFLKTGG